MESNDNQTKNDKVNPLEVKVKQLEKEIDILNHKLQEVTNKFSRINHEQDDIIDGLLISVNELKFQIRELESKN